MKRSLLFFAMTAFVLALAILALVIPQSLDFTEMKKTRDNTKVYNGDKTIIANVNVYISEDICDFNAIVEIQDSKSFRVIEKQFIVDDPLEAEDCRQRTIQARITANNVNASDYQVCMKILGSMILTCSNGYQADEIINEVEIRYDIPIARLKSV